jgi:hypothetical protein
VKLESLRVTPSRSNVTQSKSASPTVKPGPIATAPTVSPVKHVIAGEERRRSQRVLLRVHASVHVALKDKQVKIDVTTLSVNNHGALVVLKQSLPTDAQIILEHGTTKERIGCKIARPAREMPEGFHIPLEFDSPAPNFWGIAFPPSDWRPPDDL